MGGMTLRSRPRTAVQLSTAGIAMWISGGKTKKESGNCGCIWITKTSRILSVKANSVARRIRRRKVANLLIEPLAEPLRHPKQRSITNQRHDVSRPVQHCCAVRAGTEVRLHSFAQISRDLHIKVI